MTDKLSIAVIGASCRLPGADGLDAFADLLFAGRDAVSEIPDDRWTKSRFLHPAAGQPGKTYTFAAGCLDRIGAFDAAFFGISPREALSIDPQQQLMLELAYEAIEDAGLRLSRLAGSPVGVYAGGSSWDFAACSFADAAALDAYAMQGAALSSLANRVSYLFGLRGPSITIDTACSSSLVALHLACDALRRGDVGLALVGGVNLLLAPQSFVGFARASMLSRRGRCHSFDARADGYVRGEGGGAVVLKPLAAALADGDAIRAVIRASGVNSDGRTNGFSLPSGEAQAALMRRVMDEAGIDPGHLCYFEAHGTGTPVGDPIEAHAIGTALAQRRSAPLPIGSVKSNIGHLEPASFMAGLMKLILAFERGVVPASLHFEQPNPHIPFAELNLEVVAAARELRPGPEGALAGINSFGFGGTNAHAVLAAPPARAVPDGEEAPAAPLLVSARSAEALRALAAAWRDRLREAPPALVPALLRGAARLRDHHVHRLAVVAADPATLAGRLDVWLECGRQEGLAAGQAVSGELAFVFSGNGSQWAGMARDALALSADFAAALGEVDARLGPELGWSVAGRIGQADLEPALRNTAVAQPLLFAVQVASVVALRAQGVRAAAHVGHSAGEVAAAWASGALTLDQACHVIIQRSLAQQATHGDGAMAALGIDEAAAEALFASHGLPLTVAAVNGRAAVTVAGPAESIRRLGVIAGARDWPFTGLDLDYAFHSPAMDPIQAPLLAALGRLTPAAPADLLVSTVTGAPVGAGDLDAIYWWHNVRQPVLFRPAVETLIARGLRLFIEIGPAPVLQSFLRDAVQRAGQPGRVLASLTRQPAERNPFAAIAAACHVAGAGIEGAPGLDGFATARWLPTYPWQRQRFRPMRSIEAVELVSPVRDHPLLGFRDPQSCDAWMSHLSTVSEPFLADHAVDGMPVLPAAAMIEMALAAARARHPEAATLELQDLEITRPLALEPGSERDCRVSVGPDGQMELASRPRLTAEALVLHASCRILPGLGTTPVLLPPPRLEEPAEEIGAEAVYAAAESLRLQYGPAFRTVGRVRRAGPAAAVADLLPPVIDRVALGYLLDPVLVDGSLQALLALVADRPHLAAQGAVLPWRFGRVRLLRPAGAQPRQAYLQLRHIGPRSVCADIALHDADGVLVAELLECWFVAMPARAAALADQTFWTAYVPSARQPRAASPDLLGRVFASVPGREDMPPSVLLADAFAAAVAFEALQACRQAARLPPPDKLHVLAMGWLAEDGYAGRDAEGWRLAAATDLPPSGDIWRSLFFEAPQAGAEATLLAALGPALAGTDAGTGLLLSPALREQILFASPTAAAAMEALLRSLGTVTATWPAGRCLRLAAVGALHAPLLRRVVERMASCGIPLRLVLLAHEPAALTGVQELVADTPGVVARLWDALPAAERHGHDPAAERQSFDIVLDLYGLSAPLRHRLDAGALTGLLAPGGLLLGAEPAESRLAALLFGPATDPDFDPVQGAAVQPPEAWCTALADAGCANARQMLLDGALWPVALLAGSRGPEPSAEPHPAPDDSDLVVFAAPDDPLAAALSARQGILRLLPIEALKDALTAPFAATLRHLLLLAPGATDDDSGAEMLPELLADISAALLRMPASASARLWLVARGSPVCTGMAAGLAGLRRVAANELPGLECRTLCLDTALPAEAAAERIAQELAGPDDEAEAWWRAGGRFVPRLRRYLPPALPVAGPRRLEVVRPGLISSLAWRHAVPAPPGPGEVAIEVRAAALNFRDVMWAQGLLPDEALLEGFSGPSLGLECAGVVTAVGEGVDDLAPGDRVVAVAPAALATHAVTRRNGVMRVPDGLDFAAAATIPVAFMTAIYALGRLARLEAGERVLIHGGAGGVGLAAIQYALHKGAVVYATAGSAMRRQMLRMLGVAGVFDSRSAGFVDDLLAATDGAGVDVVLNSLSGELMKQSVRLLRPFGRFLEIGKRDLYRNTSVGIRPLRHNAAYFAIDIDELVGQRPALGQAVLDEVAALLEQGCARPLPYRPFGFAEVVDAFRLLQSSGHVGKLVLLPEPTPPAPARAAFAADPGGVYLVTGGLSGFGLEAARWLARQGARQLALLSRRGEATPGAEAALTGFAAAGVDARAYACDVADEAQLHRTLARIRRGQGPLRGVLHAALVLDDARLAELDAARFAAVIRPKLGGAAALDRLTRGDPLDLFVLFSSVTTVIGTPGQANYVAANAALETLAERRHAAGLPALAVLWGPIGDAGYLVRESRVSDMLAKMLGSAHLRAAQALEALPALLACGRCVVGLADIAWGELRGRLPGLAAPFWSEMPHASLADQSGSTIRARLAGLGLAEAGQVVLEVLVEEVAAILKLAPSAIDVSRPVLEFGVDSLMGVELRTALESRLGVQLPLLALSGATTLSAMSRHLLAALQTDAASSHDVLKAAILRHEGQPGGDGEAGDPASAGARAPAEAQMASGV